MQNAITNNAATDRNLIGEVRSLLAKGRPIAAFDKATSIVHPGMMRSAIAMCVTPERTVGNLTMATTAVFMAKRGDTLVDILHYLDGAGDWDLWVKTARRIWLHLEGQQRIKLEGIVQAEKGHGQRGYGRA